MALTIADQAVAAGDIDEAVARGILTSAQRDAVAAIARARRQTASVPDDEQFRLLTGFNDIFVTLAIVVLIFGLNGIVVSGLGRAIGEKSFVPLAILSAALTAALSWGLAAYFTARRRMALPSIVLLLAFVIGAATVGGFVAQMVAPPPQWGNLNEFTWKNGDHRCVENARYKFGTGKPVLIAPEVAHPLAQCRAIARGEAISLALSAILAGIVGALAAAAHWRQYHVPITIAAGATAVVALLFGLLQAVAPGAQTLLLVLAGVAGVAVFGLAMRFDITDPRRETRRTDVAFWLHLLAAPLIVHPLMSGLGVFGPHPSSMTALVVIGLYLVFTAIALVIDRRALLVSALAYVLYAISTLFRAGASDLQIPLTALVLGLFLVSLSALWRQARAAVVGWLPGSWATRLPVTAH